MNPNRPSSNARSNMSSTGWTGDVSMNKGFLMNAFSIRSATQKMVALALLSIASNVVAADSLLLSNAIVHTISGETFSPGQVLIRDGKIEAVGKTASADRAKISGTFVMQF